jgi:hypothetical protein
MLQPGVCPKRIRAADVSSYGVTGDELKIRGEQDVKFRVNNQDYDNLFCVSTVATDADGIIGTDLLRSVSAKFDLEGQKLWLLKNKRSSNDSSKEEVYEARGTAHRAAPTVFSFITSRDSRRKCSDRRRQNQRPPRRQCGQRNPKVNISEENSWREKATESINNAPRVEQTIVGKTKLPKRPVSPETTCSKKTRREVNAIADEATGRTSTKNTVREERKRDKFCKTLDIGKALDMPETGVTRENPPVTRLRSRLRS